MRTEEVFGRFQSDFKLDEAWDALEVPWEAFHFFSAAVIRT